MTTITPMPPATAPTRGQVSQTWVEALILAGFMDDAHLNLVIGEYQKTLSASDQATLKQTIDAARAHRASLTPVDFADVIVGSLADPKIDAILADPKFVMSFQQRQYRFATVRADKLIAVQTHVYPRHDQVPTDAAQLLDFCLPNRWDVPAEISFIQPNGPIHITSSTPTLNNLQFELDAANCRISISPAPHINLVQVQEFSGKFYLRNGYHRVYDLLANGNVEIPALVTTAAMPMEIDLGPMAFGWGYLISQQRPPLVADFLGGAAVKTKARERRYGVTVNLDLKPFNIGI